MWEWVLDWYAYGWYTKTQTGCSDCTNLTAASFRVMRGGGWRGSADGLRAANRLSFSPASPRSIGFRCSRSR
jgi:sulfatase modifying factor 1